MKSKELGLILMMAILAFGNLHLVFHGLCLIGFLAVIVNMLGLFALAGSLIDGGLNIDKYISRESSN